MSVSIGEIYSTFKDSYAKTPKRLRLLDVFIVWAFLSGVIQFVYVCQVGTYPFNAFLAGFLSTVGTFVLLAALRIQLNSANKKAFGLSEERCFADFVFCNVIFHLAVVNFLG